MNDHELEVKSGALEVVAHNDSLFWPKFVLTVRNMRTSMDKLAEKLAKDKAEWHDNPKAEDHAEFHAPADIQFPREARDKAIIEMVRYCLNEETITRGR